MKSISLNGREWTVRCAQWSLPHMPLGLRLQHAAAQVPGCVHQALEEAGVIPPTDLRDGETQQAWVGNADWVWRRSFDVPQELLRAQNLELVFGSIDTVAEVSLNGTVLGEGANQFHPQRFSVRHLLRPLDNQVKVVIRGPVAYVKAQEKQLGHRPVNGGWTPYPFIRKSACSFGWDWGPQAPSLGLGNVSLEAWSHARLVSVRPLVRRCTKDEALIEVHVVAKRNEYPTHELPPLPSPPLDAAPPCEQQLDWQLPPADCEAEVTLTGPDGREWSARVPLVLGRAVATLHVLQPERWWPRGYGPAHLYDMRVRIHARQGPVGVAASGVIANWRRRIGLRSVELDTTPDAHGERFALVVNQQPVFCVGANWIPAALHPVTASTERYNVLLEAACDANLNMLRVWGGGIYETEHFYERCDELGLMVWQDFMFACATYPEDEPYPELVEREARFQVGRLASHPCVMLWCGGNEDVLAWQSWGFREQLVPEQSWGQKYWLELLPRICAELDPTRPYWPDSPWSGSLKVNANDPTRGDRHTWDLRVEEYRTVVPRFTSEFGHQSPPNLCTLGEALGEDALIIGGQALAARQRAGGGDEMQYAQPLALHFAPATNFEEWLYQAQLLQARAMSLAITWARANRGRSMGALFWQWNDVWSGPSWSAIDVKLRAKPLWHALQRAAAPRMVSIEPLGKGGVTRDGRGGDLVVAVVNDAADEWRPVVRVVRMDLEGREIASAKDHVVVGPRSVDTSLYIERMVGAPADPCAECVMVEVENQRGWWMYERDKDLQCTPARAEIGIEGSESEWRVRVRAKTLVRDLWIEPRDAWTRCAPNLVTLLPGEEVVIEFDLETPLTREPAVRAHAAGGVVRVEHLGRALP